MIWFNGRDLISPKANNGLLQPRLQDDDDDDDDVMWWKNVDSSTFCRFEWHNIGVFQMKQECYSNTMLCTASTADAQYN